MRKNLVAIDGTMDAVEGLHIHVVERGRRATPDDLHIRRVESVREHVPCHNPLCEGGGFSLGDVIRDWVRNRQEDFIGTSFCTGHEEQQSCHTRFEIQAALRYRP